MIGGKWGELGNRIGVVASPVRRNDFPFWPPGGAAD